MVWRVLAAALVVTVPVLTAAVVWAGHDRLEAAAMRLTARVLAALLGAALWLQRRILRD